MASEQQPPQDQQQGQQSASDLLNMIHSALLQLQDKAPDEAAAQKVAQFVSMFEGFVDALVDGGAAEQAEAPAQGKVPMSGGPGAVPVQ